MREEVGHASDHGGLAGARWTMEKVAALPCLADLGIVVLALAERLQVVDDLLLLLRLHSQRCKTRRVLQHRLRRYYLVIYIILDMIYITGDGLVRAPVPTALLCAWSW